MTSEITVGRDDGRAMLFFDDWHLNHRENLVRRVGQPSIVPEGVFEDSYLDVHSGYPSVFRDPDTGTWRCLYQGAPHSEKAEVGTYVAALIESEDGVRWEVPDLSATEIPHRQVPHQLQLSDGFFEWTPTYFDARAEDPAERLKGLVCCWAEDGVGHDCLLHVSPDGRTWKRVEGVNWHPWGIDPAAAAFWNQYRNSYCITARPSIGDRRVAIYETRDWRSFSKPEFLLQADALDTTAAEIYGMPVFPYGGMFVGFVWIYHTPPVVSAAYQGAPDIDGPYKFLHGKIDCQLIYSYNGWHFQRGLRDTFIANGEPGEHGSGLIHASSMVVTDDDTIRIYSTSSKGEHGQSFLDASIGTQSAILHHQLRLDGFCYFESAGGHGYLTTRVIFWQGGELRINVKAPHGEVRVQVEDGNGKSLEGFGFEDCVPFAGDELFWRPMWNNGRSISELEKSIVRLSVKLTHGAIYAIRGDFVPVGPYDFQKFKTRGIHPRALDSYYLD